jgi:DNA modification methylase
LVESELIHGDCLIELPKIFDKKIDLILTDPPYGTTACKWDSVIPFELMWNQLKRVIKDNGAIALFGSEPFSSALRMSNIKQFKYDWVWKKNNSGNFQLVKHQPLKIHELVSIFSNKKHNYYPQDLIKCNIVQSNKNKAGSLKHLGSEKLRSHYKQKFTNYPKSILEHKRTSKLHPTQKPVALLEYLIKTYTNENDTVLDFTMGSGSTGVACKNLNRNFIGIEKDDKYFDIAKQRIEGGLI